MSPRSPGRARGERLPPGADAEGLSSIIEGLVAGGPWKSGLALGELARRWTEVVGDRLAAETVPARLDDAGLLVVRASSSAWAAQLRFLEAEIARAANSVLGEGRVKRVSVVVEAAGKSGARER